MTMRRGAARLGFGGRDGGGADGAAAAPPANRVAAMVRARLDEAGHSAVPFDSGWIRLALLRGKRLRPVADVPIGRGYSLPLLGAASGRTETNPSLERAFANDLAAALPAVESAKGHLLRRLRAVAAAVQDALKPRPGESRFLHNSVPSLAPIKVALLASSHGQDLLREPRILIHVDGLRADLQRARHIFEIGQADEAAAALEPLRREQPGRWRRVQQSLAPGPRIEVDAVTLGFLTTANHDLVEVFRRFSETWQFSLPVSWAGHDRKIYLTSKGTRIRSQLTLIDGTHRVYWSDHLLVVEKSRRKAKLAKLGAPAAAVIDHPAFRDRTIVAVEVEPMSAPGSCLITLDEPSFCFDAATGTFERLID